MALTNISTDVLSYSFTDGRHTLDQSNSGINISVAVDGSGQITSWLVDIFFPGTPPEFNTGDQYGSISTRNNNGPVLDSGYIYECLYGSGFGTCSTFDFDSATISNQPGTWSVVPIPAAAWLFGSALAGLGWFRSKRKL
ncbi:MAG: VPLPA-CTERM sorting domain-containing protein [Gammaproteobacteria bacterium]